MRPPGLRPFPRASDRGISLVELTVVLVVLAIGLLAVGQLFPIRPTQPGPSHLTATADDYARQKLEQLGELPAGHPDLAPGHHPASGGVEDLGHWRRWYEVEAVASAPGLRKITVTVSWDDDGPRSLTSTTFARP